MGVSTAQRRILRSSARSLSLMDTTLYIIHVATVKDYTAAKENFDALQSTVGDKMAVTLDEFDDIFSLICQDPAEHFELFDCWDLGKAHVVLLDVCRRLFIGHLSDHGTTH